MTGPLALTSSISTGFCCAGDSLLSLPGGSTAVLAGDTLMVLIPLSHRMLLRQLAALKTLEPATGRLLPSTVAPSTGLTPKSDLQVKKNVELRASKEKDRMFVDATLLAVADYSLRNRLFPFMSLPKQPKRLAATINRNVNAEVVQEKNGYAQPNNVFCTGSHPFWRRGSFSSTIPRREESDRIRAVFSDGRYGGAVFDSHRHNGTA